MKLTAVVAAAGLGRRLKKQVPKLFVKIGGKEILLRTLEVLSSSKFVNEIIVVANKKSITAVKKLVSQRRLKKIKDVVAGGSRRQDSVKEGLKRLSLDTDFVLVHDAARPFIDTKTISKVISAAKHSGAAIVGVPAKATLKEVGANLFVRNTLNRDSVWEIQTPQVFKKSIILDAYRKFNSLIATDDSSLVERLGAKVKLVEGSYFNIKITTEEDLLFAEAIIRSRE